MALGVFNVYIMINDFGPKCLVQATSPSQNWEIASRLKKVKSSDEKVHKLILEKPCSKTTTKLVY